MHVDARTLPDQSLLQSEICIVGSGPAGIAMALDLAKAKRRVILLEAGGFEYDDEIQNDYRGNNTGQPYFPLRSTRLHYFGGTSGHWGGFCAKFDPIDFRQRSWISDSGWPINENDLEPFYPAAHKLVQLGSYEWNADYWLKKRSHYRSLFPGSKYLWDKIWMISAPTRFGKTYKEDVIDNEYITLYTYASVTDIVLNDALNTVESVTIKNREGKTHRVQASVFVLATGGLQNARLLLANNKQIPQGIGNDHDVVGRYFMEHIELWSGEMLLQNPGHLDFYMLKRESRAELAVKADVQEQMQLTNGTISFTPVEVATKIPAHIKAWTTEDPLENVDHLHAEMEESEENKVMKRLRENYRNAFSMYSRFESVPNRESRVFLDTEKDALGMPLASLHWKLSDLDKISIRKINTLVGQLAGAAGLGRVRLADFLHDQTDNSWPPETSGGWHHMGTTRMGTNVLNSVVDQNCKVHTVSNLYCAGSSCFPTGGAASPTMSLIALSLRLSDHLKKQVYK